MSEFEPGAMIDGRYRVLSRVGAGGMADVYLAQDEQLGRELAVKLLHRRFAEDPDFVERFRREAQAAASLQHPNVVSVFDRGSFDGTYYIAMEYLPGRSLKQVIREEAPLDPDRAVELTIQILKAARFAHRRGVIHRDLKPHNVIIDDNDHAKVTDFGIARAGASDMTETGSIMGTAQYLSPEQAQGHTVSAPSDLYSVAIVLYEMLTGRVPFDGDSAVTIALKHVSEAPVPPSHFNPAVNASLDQVVMWALNKDPGNRPADADQFIAALEQVRGTLTGPVGEITASMRAVSLGAAAAAYQQPPPPPGTAVAVYENAQNPQVNGGRVDRYDDDKDDGDRPIWPWLAGLLVVLLIGGGITAYLLTRPSKVTMPGLVNLSEGVATRRVEALGLNPTIITETSATTPSGEVSNQNPDQGVQLKQGATVTLTISQGPGNVNVPSVVGLAKKAAMTAIKQAGLEVARITDQESSSVAKGQAIGTDPQAGTSLPKGQGVTLEISSGQTASLPDVTTLTLAQAEQQLNGYKVTTTEQTSTTATAGTVISQNPPGGSTVNKGSSVQLTVAQASTTTTVPDVITYTQQGATAQLEGDGFKVVPVYKVVTNSSQVGNVVDQRPEPNAVRKKGATVEIVIGQAPATTTTTGSTTTPTTPTTPAPTTTTPVTTPTTTTPVTTTTTTTTP